MYFPKFQEVERYREMTTVFGGYNHQISCQEGQFYDMKNMTSKYFPSLSPRSERGIVKAFTNPQGILDKEDLWWIDDKVLYKNGQRKYLPGVNLSSEQKSIAKMGAYMIVMPDKVWVNTRYDSEYLECGYMENKVKKTGVTVSICEASGKVITWHDDEWFNENKAQDGDYKLSVNTNGKPSLKVYSATTGIWMTVASTYVQISASGIGKGFEKEDGIRISGVITDERLNNIFINEEKDGTKSTNTYIIDRTDDAITIPGIFSCSNNSGSELFAELELTVERKVPEMSFITECNNRLWGCSTDGHEIYCSKLGDVKNWNCFRGASTDSWAATIGSDGKFTGAITYLGYPMFFKEDSLVKVAVSSVGGHQVKETMCRGVQSGSEGSLAVLNEVLYYKSTMGVCGYTGSLPYNISDELGEVKYYDAVAGAIGDKYYISMRGGNNAYSLFVYDVKNQMWCKEDDTRVYTFCKHKDDLYFIDAKSKSLKSIGGTLPYDVPEKAVEDRFEWFAESGTMGYASPDNKYVGRITMRLTMEVGTDVGFFLEYDSSGVWEHKFSITGSGTKTFSIPIIPRRCDHFRYRIVGKGDCKIHSVTKTIEEGSEG